MYCLFAMPNSYCCTDNHRPILDRTTKELAIANDTTIQFGTAPHSLDPCPVNKDWILEGNPIARMKPLSTSADGTATTVVWDCTAGRFNWFYSIDETVYVLEGSVTLKGIDGVSCRVSAGETVFFPAGSMAEWTVDSYIRKVAFLRSPLPRPLAAVRRFLKRMKHAIRGGPTSSGPAMFGG